MVSVAVIDDGIYTGLYDVGDLKQSIYIDTELKIKAEVKGNTKYNTSHGTICAAILKKYYNNISLTNVKILGDKSNTCTRKQLIRAIKWCIENNIQVINLSLGTVKFEDFNSIKDIINSAYNKGIIVIAACNNNDIFTYPASCSNVIGVKTSRNDTLVLNEGEYFFNLYPLDCIDIIACSEHVLKQKGEKLKVTHTCNSYATPMITAKVCSILDENPGIGFQGIRYKLYCYSINYSNKIIQINNYKNLDWINSAVVLSDSKCKCFAPNSFIKEFVELKQIKNIDFNKFDTMIFLLNKADNFKGMLFFIKYFSKKNKNIVFINTDYSNKNQKLEVSNYSVKMWDSQTLNNFFKGYLPWKKLDVPVIIIYSNSENYILKVLNFLTSKFRKDGYYSIGVYSEPIAVLYGLEYIPNVKIDDFSCFRKRLEMLYRMYNFDVIILGVVLNKIKSSPMKVNSFVKPDVTIINTDPSVQQSYDYLNLSQIKKDTKLFITTKCISDYRYNINECIIETNNFDLLYKQIVSFLIDDEKYSETEIY